MDMRMEKELNEMERALKASMGESDGEAVAKAMRSVFESASASGCGVAGGFLYSPGGMPCQDDDGCESEDRAALILRDLDKVCDGLRGLRDLHEEEGEDDMADEADRWLTMIRMVRKAMRATYGED